MAQNIIRLIPKKARLGVYGVYGILGVVIGAIQVGYSAAELGQPVWLTVTLAVYAFLGGAFGYTASTHGASDEGDLVGPTGPPGPMGPMGITGEPGADGRDGLNFGDSSARAEIERLIRQRSTDED